MKGLIKNVFALIKLMCMCCKVHNLCSDACALEETIVMHFHNWSSTLALRLLLFIGSVL